MRRMMTVALVAALLAGAAPALAAEGEARISGQVAEIRSDGKLVLEEQGPWKGPNTGVTRRTVSLGPDTVIRVVRPTGTWGANDVDPGWAITAGDFRELNRGDFVTVTTGRGASAVAIDVVRQDGADNGLASPGADAPKK
jgi:hypothetical protein